MQLQTMHLQGLLTRVCHHRHQHGQLRDLGHLRGAQASSNGSEGKATRRQGSVCLGLELGLSEGRGNLVWD